MTRPNFRSVAATLAGLAAPFGLSAALGVQRPTPKTALDAEAVTVRLLLGIGDAAPTPWDGKVSVDRGKVTGIDGWRLREGGRPIGREGWEARSLSIRKVAAKKVAPALPANKVNTGPSTTGPTVTPGGVLVTVKAPEDATLRVGTGNGAFEVPLASLAEGGPRRYLDGKVEALRVPPTASVVAGPLNEDFPTAAADARGVVWLAYVEHSPFGPEASEALTEVPKDFGRYVPKEGGDRIRLVRFAEGRAGEPIDVTGPGLDVWRPAVAVDGRGRVVVVWAARAEGNWDLFRRIFDPIASTWSDTKRLTTNPGTDADAALAVGPDGRVWMAWQTWIEGGADIALAPVEDVPAEPSRLRRPGTNEWSPSLAIDRAGKAFVAFDTYGDASSYDVGLCATATDTPRLVDVRTIAGSSRCEYRPSLAVDARGRAWIAYEERDAHWGKDAENLVEGEGSSLYRSSAVRVVCLDGDRLTAPPDPVAGLPESERRMNSYPRLAIDASGRVWLTYRHRQESIWGNNAVLVVGGVWVSYAALLGAEGWSLPKPVPFTDNLLDNRPPLVAVPGGPVLLFASSDGRLRREVEGTPDLTRRFYTHSGTPPGVVQNDLFVAALAPRAGPAAEPILGEAVPAPVAEAPVHPAEADDVARMRGHRIAAGGKSYRFLRGEFHRHTEISQDGGADGSLDDMWRYAIDAGHLDWIGNGDHDNGGGKEYTWWLIQKATDLYHHAPAFLPMFTYERSVAYPGGHRNVMFPRRGVRTLPRLVDDQGVRTRVRGVDEDARMLYDYLNTLGGICASHTSATGMGTDWRANDPKAEPFVEIFQGHRQSYEYLGAPRSALRKEESIGGWQPLGMVWNALALQHRMGFQASSDHISTHISFAVAIAEDATREALFDAFRRRHCYGATDNILLDVRSGEHLMGDEFDAEGPVRLKVLAHAPAPIARIDVIKDFRFAYTAEPGKPRVESEWTDAEARPAGTSWYYVRVLTEDGEIAWGSPMWIRSRAVAGAR